MKLYVGTYLLAFCWLVGAFAYLVQGLAITPRIRFGKQTAWFWSAGSCAAGLVHLLLAYHTARNNLGGLQSPWMVPLAAGEAVFVWWGLATLQSWRIELHRKNVGDRRKLRFFDR